MTAIKINASTCRKSQAKNLLTVRGPSRVVHDADGFEGFALLTATDDRSSSW